MKPKLGIFLGGLAAAILVACSHEHEQDKGGAGEPSVAVTHYTGETELFVEFPALVRGQDAEFVAHLTRLRDFQPVGEGTLVATLSGGGQAEEHGETGVSGTPGIFKPLLTPRHAGKRRLTNERDFPVAATASRCQD